MLDVYRRGRAEAEIQIPDSSIFRYEVVPYYGCTPTNIVLLVVFIVNTNVRICGASDRNQSYVATFQAKIIDQNVIKHDFFRFFDFDRNSYKNIFKT